MHPTLKIDVVHIPLEDQKKYRNTERVNDPPKVAPRAHARDVRPPCLTFLPLRVRGPINIPPKSPIAESKDASNFLARAMEKAAFSTMNDEELAAKHTEDRESSNHKAVTHDTVAVARDIVDDDGGREEHVHSLSRFLFAGQGVTLMKKKQLDKNVARERAPRSVWRKAERSSRPSPLAPCLHRTGRAV